MEAIWRVEMLGALRLIGAVGTIEHFRTRHVAQILARLAYFRHQQPYRDDIAEALWPEREPESARRNLRQALSSLRHVTEPPGVAAGSVLQIQSGRVRLNPDAVSTDVAEFEELARGARRLPPYARVVALRRALDLYRGELLPEFTDEWVVRERNRLHDIYIDTLRAAVAALRADDRLPEAAEWLAATVSQFPLDEDLLVEAMGVLTATGRPGDARIAFEHFRAALADELGLEPGPLTLDLYERALHTPTLPTAPVAINSPSVAVSSPGPDEAIVRIPLIPTRIRGRDDEIALVQETLDARDARLITLLGPAGAGKTRIAVELGRRLGESGAWNVWFVPLADLAAAAMIPDAILSVIRGRGSAHADTIDQIRDVLPKSRANLIILDNLEHFVADATPIVEAILERIPTLRIVTTSRQVLNLGSEALIPVPPLPIPFPDRPIPDRRVQAIGPAEIARIAAYPSVQLFVDRCQMMRPDFQITPRNAAAICDICARLDGIPLALELAAGLSGSFTPSQMVAHLQRRLTVLSSRRRELPPRHRSLRAAIDYSYETLTDPQRALFAALSLFRGGFTPDAVRDICLKAGETEADALERLLELHERSLIRADSDYDTHEPFFRLLDTFREYGRDLLEPERYAELRHRHANYYLGRPHPSDRPPTSEERTARHLWIESQYDNYIAALEYLYETGDIARCIILLGILSSAWSGRGPREIERTYIRNISDHPAFASLMPSSQILLLRMLGTSHIRTSNYEAALRVCQRALAVAETHQLTEQIAVCNLALATCSGYLGRLEDCLRYSERVLETLPADNLPLRERAYLGIGAVHWGLGDAPRAEAAYSEAAEISARQRGGEADILIIHNLARVNLDEGRLDQGMAKLGEGMRICRRLHDEFGLAICLTLVSRYHWLREQYAAAISTGYDALVKHRETDFLHWSLLGINQHALILASMGEYEPALVLLAATEGINRPARRFDQIDLERAIALIRPRLTPENYERAWAKGLAMDTEDAFRLALAYR